MTIRESVQIEIDTLSEDMLFIIRDFVMLQKEHILPNSSQQREKNIEWLQESWNIDDFKPLPREKLYDR